MPKDAVRRTLLWAGAVDLALTLAVLGIWVGMFGVDLRLAIPLMIVRISVWVVQLLRLLEPVRTWEHGTTNDRQLLAADAALQQVQRRFLMAYAGGWLGTEVLGLLLSQSAELGSAQFVSAQLASLSVVLCVPALMVPTLNHATFPIHAEISTALLERGLEPPRPRAPLARSLMFVFLSLCSAAIMGLGGTASWLRANGREQQFLEQQRARAELEATRFAAGIELDAATELRPFSALPPELLAQGGAGPIVIIDRERDLGLAAAPLDDGRWVLLSADFDEQTWLTVLGLLLAAALALTPGVVASVALATVVTGPLRRLDDATRKVIETGSLRGQSRVMTLSNDELGDLAGNFNRMLDVFEELAAAASKVAEGDLAVNLDRPGDLQDAFRAMIARLSETVDQIRATALEVAAAAAEIQASTQEQERASELQAQSLREVGDAVADLAQSAEAITTAAVGVLEDAEQTRVNTDLTVARTTELSSQATGIGTLLGIIGEIAERSDLLALNGSLEAVRAGEAGRGFALVATEMRRLAERVTGTVADVGGQVTAMQAASASTEAATIQSRNLAENTAQAARKISRETEQQGQSTDQLAISVHEVVEIAAATSAATTQTRATAEGLRAHAEYLEQLTTDFRLPSDE